MKAQDLRIGNLVLSSDNLICELVSVDPLIPTVSFKNRTGSLNFYTLNHIPLTDEWLVKFGFRRRSLSGDVLWDNSHMEISFMGSKFHPSVNINEYIIGPEIKYVHQLQNIHYALSGEELTLIEKP